MVSWNRSSGNLVCPWTCDPCHPSPPPILRVCFLCADGDQTQSLVHAKFHLLPLSCNCQPKSFLSFCICVQDKLCCWPLLPILFEANILFDVPYCVLQDGWPELLENPVCASHHLKCTGITGVLHQPWLYVVSGHSNSNPHFPRGGSHHLSPQES